MDKYYVIPVDSSGNAYLGIKSPVNPHGDKPVWNAGAPNPFGGNSDHRSIKDTAYFEAREESHYKIDINTEMAEFTEVHKEGNMTFYTIQGNFNFDPNAYFSRVLLDKPKFRETTGEVLMVDLKILDVTNANTVANGTLEQMKKQLLSGNLTGPGETDFRTSATCEAIRKAALAFR